jgi:hypothetical protein
VSSDAFFEPIGAGLGMGFAWEEEPSRETAPGSAPLGSQWYDRIPDERPGYWGGRGPSGRR